MERLLMLVRVYFDTAGVIFGRSHTVDNRRYYITLDDGTEIEGDTPEEAITNATEAVEKMIRTRVINLGCVLDGKAPPLDPVC